MTVVLGINSSFFAMKAKWRAFRAALFMVCAAGFMWQVWDQVDKFVRGITTVAASWRVEKAIHFPSAIFCDRRGFRESGTISTREEFHSRAYAVNITLVNINDYDKKRIFANLTDAVDEEELATFYNGACRIFRFPGKFGANIYIEFTFPKGTAVQVFLVEDGEESLIMSQNLKEVPASFEVTAISYVQVEKTIMKASDKKLCRDYAYKNMTDCMWSKVEEVAESKGIQCVSFLHVPFMPKFKGKECTTPASNVEDEARC